MKFSTALIASAIAAPALAFLSPAQAAYYNETISTATAIHTTVVTITSCSDNKCTEKPVTTGVTTVTENDTVYTTWCPLTTEGAESKPSTVAAESVAESKPSTVAAESAAASSSPAVVAPAEGAAGAVKASVFAGAFAIAAALY